MKDHEINLKFYRIINGYFYLEVDDTKYKILYPTNEQKYEAEMLYASLIEDSKFDSEYFDKNNVNIILSAYSIWTPKEKQELLELDEKIDEYKIKIFQNYDDKKHVKQAKLQLDIMKEMKFDLLYKKHSYDYLTRDHVAQNAQNQYIISQCIYTSDNKPVFPSDYYEIDVELLKKIIAKLEKYNITSHDLRAICRSDVWKNYTCQTDIFGSAIDMNDDQRNLLFLQKMYNNVYEHPECPEDSIINDDDALDGWFLYHRRKVKKQKKKNEVLSKVRGKVKEHDFVYIIADSKEEENVITELNDFRGHQYIRAINKAVAEKEAGEQVIWKDIDYIKQDIIRQNTKK